MATAESDSLVGKIGGQLFRDSRKACAHVFNVDMGSTYDRQTGVGRGGGATASPAPHPSSEESVPDFRALLRRAATDLRGEAAGRDRADQKDRLLKLAEILDSYANESPTKA